MEQKIVRKISSQVAIYQLIMNLMSNGRGMFYYWHPFCVTHGMMKCFRSLVLAVAAVSLSMVATAVKANTVKLYKGSYSYSVGGEFTAITSQNFLGNGYVAETEETVHGVTGFQTFCVETGVPFSPGTQYSYELGSSTASDGGLAGSGIPLSIGAAFLYYEFATGNLTGYNYGNTDISKSNPSRLTDAGLLQAAIWYFQGKQTYPGFDGSKNEPSITSDPFYILAIDALGGTLADALAANDGTYGVEILQLMNGDHPAQAQLVLTPPPPPVPRVPDGGTTVMLLGGALAGLQILRRTLRR